MDNKDKHFNRLMDLLAEEKKLNNVLLQLSDLTFSQGIQASEIHVALHTLKERIDAQFLAFGINNEKSKTEFKTNYQLYSITERRNNRFNKVMDDINQIPEIEGDLNEYQRGVNLLLKKSLRTLRHTKEC